MGSGKSFKCSKCDYIFTSMTGVGMLFVTQYQRTVEEIKAGKFGTEWQHFFEEHPDGKVDCGRELLVCKYCGVPKTDTNLSLYLPKEDSKEKLSEYPLPFELKEEYTLYAKFPHKCKNCGGACKIVTDVKKVTLNCPECGEPMKEDLDLSSICWD